MPKKMLSCLLAILALMSFSSCSGEPPVMPEPKISSSVPEKPSVGEDFYGSFNYDYLTTSQIPHNKNGISSFDSIQDALEQDVSDIIDRCVAGTPEKGSFEEMVKEIYQQYLDTDARNQAGADSLLVLVQAVENCKTPDELVSILGMMYQEYGVSSFFRFNVMPDSYDTSINRLHLMNMNTCGNMKENFTKTDDGSDLIGELAVSTLSALKVAHTEAVERARNVVSMIYEIALATSDYQDMLQIEKHYNLRKTKELSGLFTNIDTENLMNSFGFHEDQIVVYEWNQSEKINEFFTAENMRTLKDYVLVCLMYQYSNVMPPSYSDSISGLAKMKKNPEKSAKEFVANLLEEELGILYGRETCTDKVMEAALKMTDDIKASCRHLIENCERLGEESKKRFLSKLDHIIFLIGYNKEYQSPFTITPAKDGGTLIDNAIAVQKGKTAAEAALLSQKPDRNKWSCSAITVNAFYRPAENCITIPAVMLSKTSFDPDKGDYFNLGMMGYVIAHEMNHAFDSNGFKYNETGCYTPDWMNEKDEEAYRQVMEKAEAYYENYKILGIYHVNGQQTLSENIADLGAVQCIVNITDDKEQLRQIFEGVATQWAQIVQVTDVVQQMEGDEHSPAEARVNAVLSSVDKFYEVYDIKEGDKMYVAPENRVKVW